MVLHVGVGVKRSVRVNHAFGLAGGSGGVNQGGDVVVGRVDNLRFFPGGPDERPVGKGSLRRVVFNEDHRRDIGRFLPAGLDFGPEELAADHDAGPRILINIRRLFLADQVIDGNDHRAQTPRGGKSVQHLRAVGRLDDHPVAALHAQFFQRRGELPSLPGNLPVGNFPLPVNQLCHVRPRQAPVFV